MIPLKNYTDLFQQRGRQYHQAMRRYPVAREQEFRQLLAGIPLQAGMSIADVPAGGAYLRSYLPPDILYRTHEPCVTFSDQNTDHQGHTADALLPLPWQARSLDAAVSLAGIHHIADKRPLFTELARVVRPAGTLVISDVAAGSAVAAFLDDYVGRYNSTGHEGVYLDSSTCHELEASGWQVVHSAVNTFHWVFDSEPDMADFCHLLFDIRGASGTMTLAEIDKRLGMSRLPDGRVAMNWSLMTIRAMNSCSQDYK